MKLARNAHRVFHDAPDGNDFLATISLTDAEQAGLRQARDLIRDALRAGFRDWARVIRKQDLFEQRFVGGNVQWPVVLRPKFRMQGSFAYHTINSPAQTPPQEIDVDDGVYLPTSFISAGGGRSPIIASRGYFTAVEAILAPVCEENGWDLGRDKATCVRVVLSKNAHVDLPLYAIPDEQFATMVEKAMAMEAFSSAYAAVETAELNEAVYRELREDELMLAHREEGWKESDPRKIETWFTDAIADHGPQLRRVCRYIKSWRDHTWAKSPLSSIAIMRCVVDAYDGADGDMPQTRDDFALLAVAERLPDLLSASIGNPVIADQVLDEGWDDAQREEIVSAAKSLAATLWRALVGPTDAAGALSLLASAFGNRIPSDTSLIMLAKEEARVLSYEPTPVAAPAVPRTTSG